MPPLLPSLDPENKDFSFTAYTLLVFCFVFTLVLLSLKLWGPVGLLVLNEGNAWIQGTTQDSLGLL